MTFFYDLNKRLAGLASKQLNEGKEKADKDYDGDGKIESPKDEYQGSRIAAAKKAGKMEEGAKPDFLDIDGDGDKKEPMKQAAKEKALDEADYSAKKARAGKDIGKPGKAFAQIAKDAAERYGSKEKGEKVAGAVLAKLRKEDVEEGIENLPGMSMPMGPVDHSHWLDITKSADKNFKVDNPDHELNGKTVKVVAYSKNGKSVVVDFEGKRHNVRPEDLAKRKQVQETKSKAKNAFDPEVARSMFSPEKGKTKTGHDVKDTGYSKRYTKKLDDESEDQEDDDTPKSKGRKAVGAGKGKKIGAKVKGTSKLHRKGAIAECSPEEYGMEGDKAKKDLKSVAMAAKELHSILGDNQDLPEWVQDKITRALDYINSSNQYMHQEMGDMEVAEVAPPGAKAERMVKGIKKALSKDGKLSDKDKAIAYATTWKAHKEGKVEEESTETKDQRAERAGKKVAKDIEYDEGHKGKDDNRAEKAGKKVTKDIEYDDKKDKVKETDAPKKAKGGIVFGQGVYESLNSKLENMIAEGMSVNVNMNIDENGKPTKSVSVNAEGEQAELLAQLLNLAGLHKQEEAGCGCGTVPCSCDQVDEAYGDTKPTENKPDYPTDKETTGEDDELLRRWAGGLNKPKSTGQTTIPVIASQTERQVSEQTDADRLGMNLYAELKSFKAK